jgi:4-hydroxy-3-polyprenylbenzoate decarboxylase/2,5-furandicarboxylate decarboxylase 1
MPFKDLREFIAFLERENELQKIKKPVDPCHEIAAYIRKSSDSKGPALLFENVKNSEIPVIGGVLATRHRVLLALGVAKDDYETYMGKFLNAMDHLVPPKLVSSGPCQEVIYLGDDIDVTRLPVPTLSAKDSGPFITAGVVISRDPETRKNNTSIYRLQVHGPRRIGIKAQQLSRQQNKAESKDERFPVAIAIGTDPILYMATQWDAPYGVDEMALAGALRGGPVEVVKAKTVDLEVPANAEIVIEGHVLPNVREPEGPFGEVAGYYSPRYPKPVVEITAITHRKNPIFQTSLTGMPTTENHTLKQIPIEAAYYAELRKKFPGITAVHFPAAGAVSLMVVVAMKQSYRYEARNVIATMFGSRRNKMVVVVDNDVDVFDMEKVLWAISTRCRMDEDLIVFPRLSTTTIDPTAEQLEGTSSFWAAGLGIDATLPFGAPVEETVNVIGVEKVSLNVKD